MKQPLFNKDGYMLVHKHKFMMNWAFLWFVNHPYKLPQILRQFL